MSEHQGLGGGAGGREFMRHDADDKVAGDDALPLEHRTHRGGKRKAKREGKRKGARK